MRYTVTNQRIQVIGRIWQPGIGLCAMQRDLTAHDMSNMDPTDRASVAARIDTHFDDFSSIADFRADFTIDGKQKTLNWSVTLERNGVRISTDYMQGIGHVPEWRELPRTLYFEGLRRDFENAAETGKYPHRATRDHVHEHGTRLDIVPGYQLKALSAPSVLDVLHSLLLDSDAASETFEDWCSNYGYDTDSRKAEQTYQTCNALGIKLHKMLDASTLTRLSELFQDY